MGVSTGIEADLVIIACRTQSPEPIRPERCRLCSDMGHGPASLFPSYTLPFSHGPPAINSTKLKQAPPKDPSSSQWHSFIAFGRLTFLALVFTSFPFHCLTVSSLPPFHTICTFCTPYTFLVFKSSPAPGSRPKPLPTVHHSPFTISRTKRFEIFVAQRRLPHRFGSKKRLVLSSTQLI